MDLRDVYIRACQTSPARWVTARWNEKEKRKKKQKKKKLKEPNKNLFWKKNTTRNKKEKANCTWMLDEYMLAAGACVRPNGSWSEAQLQMLGMVAMVFSTSTATLSVVPLLFLSLSLLLLFSWSILNN